MPYIIVCLLKNINTLGEVREAVGLVGVVGIFDGDESADLLSISLAATPGPSSVAVDGDGFAVC